MKKMKQTFDDFVKELVARRLAASWTFDIAKDLNAMYGVDVNAECVNIMSYEIKKEIDRRILVQFNSYKASAR